MLVDSFKRVSVQMHKLHITDENIEILTNFGHNYLHVGNEINNSSCHS